MTDENGEPGRLGCPSSAFGTFSPVGAGDIEDTNRGHRGQVGWG